MKRNRLWKFEETVMRVLMVGALATVVGCLLLILSTVLLKGLPAMNLAMLTQSPKGGYYTGAEGGILNAILGSLCLAVGATLVALLLGLPIALYLQVYAGRSWQVETVRLALDVLWGTPSIVYGAFGFSLMIFLGMRASLLGGIIALSLVELPIMCRAIEEVLKMVPFELKESTYALGATRWEVAWRVVVRQGLSGITSALLLAFGRGIGDAASVLFTAGYTDNLPSSLLRPVASLPLAIFFQLATPFPAVQQRAYASALVLTAIVLTISVFSRLAAAKLSRYAVD
ncbi:MAG TPA: phosphate ABC transporter permease PstA [Anaerolineae bacterium]|jgi:phosphate transport system permease protein|nr:phosphate ABC transporter permease PstA [Anaerolineae bacterium]